jgi:hypothetical protein
MPDVSIGGVTSRATWTHVPSNGVGLYRGSVDFSGRAGQVTVTLSRNGASILSSTGGSINNDCTQGLQNFNPFVMTGPGRSINSISPIPLDDKVGCIAGFGAPKYQNLCEVGCKYDYCPRGACTCTNMVRADTIQKACSSR